MNIILDVRTRYNNLPHVNLCGNRWLTVVMETMYNPYTISTRDTSP